MNTKNYFDHDQKEEFVHGVPMLSYLPHGVDPQKFFPIELTPEDSPIRKRFEEIKSTIFGDNVPDFIIFFNSRNIRRKMPSNILEAFQFFLSELKPVDISKFAVIFHTQPVDDNGTDLYAVVNHLFPNMRVIFSGQQVNHDDLNCLYNIADVTVNISNAEGFGLSALESIMAGTPIIATVTGGLQDQMAFRDEDGKLIKFDETWGSNHNKKYTTCGEWAFPVFPASITLTGSPPTPYIYDDYVSNKDVAEQFMNAYKLGREELIKRGLSGRNWVLSDESGMNVDFMANKFVQDVDYLFENWKPKKSYNLYKI